MFLLFLERKMERVREIDTLLGCLPQVPTAQESNWLRPGSWIEAQTLSHTDWAKLSLFILLSQNT